MRVNQAAIQDQAIRDYPGPLETTADCIKCSVFVQEAIDKAYDQPVAHTKRIERTTSGDFTDGAICGYLAYFEQHSSKALSDLDVFNLLGEGLADVRYTQLFNAGWCAGLVEALLEDRDLFGK